MEFRSAAPLVFGRIENLTDEVYDAAWTYGTAKRRASVGLWAQL